MKKWLSGVLLVSLLGLGAWQGAGGKPRLEIKLKSPISELAGPIESREEVGMEDAMNLEVVQSSVERLEAPVVPQRDLEALIEGNTAFALDLYQTLQKESGNLFFSPYSISLALAMTYAGAGGQTAQQMADVMHYSIPQEPLHAAFNALDQELAGRATNPRAEMGKGFQFHIANSLWGQKGDAFQQDFLDRLALNYGAGMRRLDYARDVEGARLKINHWVSDQTEEKIQDLIPGGALNALTRLVLANAIYFNAAWAHPFVEAMTGEQPFTFLDGRARRVPMMNQTQDLRYGSGPGWQAVELPYEGHEMSMFIVRPEVGKFKDFETGLDTGQLTALVEEMSVRKVNLYLPKFTHESEFLLGNTLQAMGMPDAFSMRADFSGMSDANDLFISEVVHKAFVDVDEEGTEAAAATAVIMRAKSMPMMEKPVEMRVDSPFIYWIQDKNGTILFLGRVVNPLD